MRRQVVRLFLLSTLCVIFFMAAGTFGYCAIVNGYGISKEEKEQIDRYLKEMGVDKKQDTVQNEVMIAPVVKTIHFITQKENEKIEDIVIEILNARSGKLLYLTIPMDLRVTLSGQVYEKLNAEAVMVPQMFKLSMLSVYFTGEKQMEAARLILEDALGMSMDHYSVLSQEYFDEVFEKMSDGAYAYREEYIEKGLGFMFDEKEALLKAYEEYDTDFSYKKRMHYMETYQALGREDYLFEKAAGSQTNDAFILDEKENKTKILTFCAAQAQSTR